ncbi:PepSY domain-containing protein [Novosphingobium malaysiense]|uniref:Peptidase M4 n=1 Tax=Novosphingobium malaysiense TaxID=1348853 RepID=A0A0B1ZVV7_9SPHN|nr:PepSY domain-containing protein [Novosphingobium malaysiense]KHK93569.1 peptidase M4 [Novosphingobium malaysiense]
MKLVSRFAVALAAVALPGTAVATRPRANISKAEAQRIALVVAHGKVMEAEYEKEDGGWRWSFDISENGRIHEIGVDAMTGKVVEDSWEAPDSAD